MGHPLPFIKELENVLEIKNLPDILKVNSFVYSLIVATTEPYSYIKEESIESLYRRFLTEEIGGWCGLNASFLKRLMDEYGVNCRCLNYGYCGSKDGSKFHEVCIIGIDNTEYLIDPYINKHYCYPNMNPMPHNVLMKKIEDRQMQDIVPVYGEGEKKIFYCSEWVTVVPKKFDELLTIYAKKVAGNFLMEKFGSDNVYLLMLT